MATTATTNIPAKRKSALILASEYEFQKWYKGTSALVSSELPGNLPDPAKEVLKIATIPSAFFNEIDKTSSAPLNWIQKPLYEKAAGSFIADEFARIARPRVPLARPLSSSEWEILRGKLPNILSACQRAKEDAECPVLSNEATRLSPIDDIIRMAFLDSERNSYAFGRETKLCMSTSTSVTETGWFSIADTCVFTRLKKFFVGASITWEYFEHLSSLPAPPWADLYILEFPCEHKQRGLGVNQLTYYMLTAQNQRRALGFKDHYVFATRTSNSSAHVYISYWSENILRIAPVETFDMTDPADCVKFFILLRQISHYITHTLNNAYRDRRQIILDEKNSNWRSLKWRVEWPQTAKSSTDDHPTQQTKKPRSREAIDWDVDGGSEGGSRDNDSERHGDGGGSEQESDDDDFSAVDDNSDDGEALGNDTTIWSPEEQDLQEYDKLAFVAARCTDVWKLGEPTPLTQENLGTLDGLPP